MTSNRVSTDEADDNKDEQEQSDDKESSDWRVVVASLGLVDSVLQFWHLYGHNKKSQVSWKWVPTCAFTLYKNIETSLMAAFKDLCYTK